MLSLPEQFSAFQPADVSLRKTVSFSDVHLASGGGNDLFGHIGSDASGSDVVLRLGHSFKVVGANTSANSAKMIYVKSRWYRTIRLFVGNAVRKFHRSFTTSYPYASIARDRRQLPNPTFADVAVILSDPSGILLRCRHSYEYNNEGYEGI